MIFTAIALITLGGAVAYSIGRVHGSRDTTDQLMDSLDAHGTIFLKVHGEDRVVTGYIETYGDWFKVKNDSRDKAQAALKAARNEQAPNIDRGNVQHAAKVIVQGTHGYEHPFLNTGSRG